MAAAILSFHAKALAFKHQKGYSGIKGSVQQQKAHEKQRQHHTRLGLGWIITDQSAEMHKHCMQHCVAVAIASDFPEGNTPLSWWWWWWSFITVLLRPDNDTATVTPAVCEAEAELIMTLRDIDHSG